MTLGEPTQCLSLYSEASSFVGHRDDLRRLARLQSTARLLTLVGPGGSGKTRLALRIAKQRKNASSGGVLHVDVADAQWEALVRAVPVVDDATLLVLDTCDADINASAQRVATLLDEHPRLQILATSQEPLGVTREVVWRMPLLRLSDGPSSRLHQLQTADANRLLIERVGGIASDMTNSSDAQAISTICRNLNGLPLAIEMAALQVGSLGLAAVAEQTSTPSVMDMVGRRDAPLRQRSLRATLDWSYSRLNQTEQHVLTSVSVFASAWTLDMARALCADIALADLTEIVTVLAKKSLVHPVKGGPDERFELSQITRWYGREILAKRGVLESLRRSHLEWCVSLAEGKPHDALDGRHARRLERDEADLRLALEWALTSGETELGLRLANATFTLWQLRGVATQTASSLQRLLAQPGERVRPEVVARAHGWQAEQLLLQGDFGHAEALVRMVLTLQQARGDAPGAGRSLLQLGNVMLWSGHLDQSREVYAEAQVVLGGVSTGGLQDLSMAIYQDARVAWELSDVDRARALIPRLLRPGRLRQPALLARTRQLQGLISAEEGDWSTAQDYLREAERLLRRLADTHGFIDLLMDRAWVLLLSAETATAHQAFVSAASLARTIGARGRLIRAIEGVACALADTQPGLCVQLAASATASRQAMHAAAWPRDRSLLLAALARASNHAGKWPDQSGSGLRSASYAEVWRAGTMQLESEAADAAIATLNIRAPAAIAEVPATVTSREWQIAQLFTSGVSTRQIAERLALSRETVRKHLDRVIAKLGLHSRVQLVTWVAQSKAAEHAQRMT